MCILNFGHSLSSRMERNQGASRPPFANSQSRVLANFCTKRVRLLKANLSPCGKSTFNLSCAYRRGSFQGRALKLKVKHCLRKPVAQGEQTECAGFLSFYLVCNFWGEGVVRASPNHPVQLHPTARKAYYSLAYLVVCSPVLLSGW